MHKTSDTKLTREIFRVNNLHIIHFTIIHFFNLLFHNELSKIPILNF